MAGKVFFSVSMSLDGFIAPESLEALMGQQWMELQQWIFPQRFFRESLKLGEGGEEGRDNDIVRETFERTGASHGQAHVRRRRAGVAGGGAVPHAGLRRDARERDPWERPGGTTFHFVNDGIEAALDQAHEAAGDQTSASRRRRNDPGVPERRPDRRVLDRALTRAVRHRNPPVRGRGRGSCGPGAGPRGALPKGDAPDLRRPGAVGHASGKAPKIPAPVGLTTRCSARRSTTSVATKARS